MKLKLLALTFFCVFSAYSADDKNFRHFGSGTMDSGDGTYMEDGEHYDLATGMSISDLRKERAQKTAEKFGKVITQLSSNSEKEVEQLKVVNDTFLEVAGPNELDGKARYDMLQKLLKMGAQVNVTDSDGQTALIKAAQVACFYKDAADSVQLLINNRSPINHTSTNGETALHKACGIGSSFSIVQKLMAAKADTTLNDKWGKTPLMREKEWKPEGEIAQYLEKIDEGSQNSKEKTAFDDESKAQGKKSEPDDQGSCCVQ